MTKRVRMIILIMVVLVAAIFIFVRVNDGEGPPYAPTSTAEMGTSLFFDTLRHMGHPVRIGYAPLTRTSDIAHVMILIQPYNPHVSIELAEEMLEWVRGGGRLIFLHNSYPTVIDRLLSVEDYRAEGEFYRYDIGYGTVVTGRAHGITNRQLINDATPGTVLSSIISGWNAPRIYFVAYYHGFHPPETMFSELPLIIRLVIIQLGIAGLALLWHLGKRFGKPIPAYEETEREENEQVRALARLYMKTDYRRK